MASKKVSDTSNKAMRKTVRTTLELKKEILVKFVEVLEK